MRATRLPIPARLRRLSLARRFLLASLVILALGMAGIGWWVGRQIEIGVVHRTAATTALYVESFVAPHLQQLDSARPLPDDDVRALSRLLRETPLGEQIVAFRIWGPGGRVIYSTSPAQIGQTLPVSPGLASAWRGEVSAGISGLHDEENVLERERSSRLLETYSPVRRIGTRQIIAVAEFYQSVEEFQDEIGAAQRQSWLVVGVVTLAMYLLLGGFVRGASQTIERQQAELSRQVARLTELLAQNEALHERVRRAASRTTALNEGFLRRISAELHDGPAQDVALALLRLDSLAARCPAYQTPGADGALATADLDKIQASLSHALQEVRTISAGLRLPELEQLTLAETLARVVHAHERRTGTGVVFSQSDLPDQAPLPVKITLYRVIQEALNNAYRHGGGAGQRVHLACRAGLLDLEVSDQGPGLAADGAAPANGAPRDSNHLGLVGMRERVESLGGWFRVEGVPGQGTRVVAQLALRLVEDDEDEASEPTAAAIPGRELA